MYVVPRAPSLESSSLRIMNGKETVPHSIPYQVHISLEGFIFDWTCGGTLISPKYVLTAAHCLVMAETIEVTLGAHNISKWENSQLRVKGINWKGHENYDRKTITNDVGVIELAYPVYPTKEIRYAKLPSKKDFRKDLLGRQARVSGWGFPSGTERHDTDVLMEVTNTIIGNDKCDYFYNIVTDEEICLSGKDGKASCSGDSGGPLVVGDVQFGIVSYGARGCLVGYPVVFTKIISYLNWIYDNTDLKNL